MFQDDTPEDKRAVQEALSAIDMYPLAMFDAQMKRVDWHSVPKFPQRGRSGGDETPWVFPETFFDQLPAVLQDIATSASRFLTIGPRTTTARLSEPIILRAQPLPDPTFS